VVLAWATRMTPTSTRPSWIMGVGLAVSSDREAGQLGVAVGDGAGAGVTNSEIV
jgi:hypothetical protein